MEKIKIIDQPTPCFPLPNSIREGDYGGGLFKLRQIISRDGLSSVNQDKGLAVSGIL